MGATCASFHLLCSPSDAAKAVARAYAKRDYERLKKPAAAAGKQVILTSQWCGNVLRTVAPEMYLCRKLVDQLDTSALVRVADVSDSNGVTHIEKQRDCPMDAYEIALLPILPSETARLILR